MRALHVITNLELAGAQSSVVAICGGLHAVGVDVHLAFSSRGGRTPGSEQFLLQAARSSGVKVHDVPQLRRGIDPRHDVRALAALVALIRRVRPDIVHTHASKAGVLGRLAGELARVTRIVHTVRGWSFYAARSRLVHALAVACERVAAQRTDAMIAVSHSLVDAGTKQRIGDPTRYRVIRSGIELARFTGSRDKQAARAALGISTTANVVGSVMALTAAKAPLDLVEVVRRVIARRPDVVFVVVGYGPLASALEHAARSAGIGEHLKLVGLRECVADLYPAFDVLLSTSRWEGLPRVAVEAIAAGIPVVATDVGGCSEVVLHGRTGYLAPAGDVETLASRVLDAIGNESLRARLGAAAPSVLAGHDLREVIAQHVALYDELVGRRRHEEAAQCLTS